MKRILIDTNIYSAAMRGEQRSVEVLRNTSEIGFSTISIGELFSGFKSGTKETINRKELKIFLDSPRVRIFPVDEETAEFYSDVLFNLKTAGKPIPTNDIWIASVAFQQGLKLFTYDEHFKNVAGLSLV